MKSIAVIGGAGEGLGAALGRRFAAAGLDVVLSSRTQQGIGKCDLREESEVVALFDRLEAGVDLGYGGDDLHSRNEGRTGPVAGLEGHGSRNWKFIANRLLDAGVPGADQSRNTSVP